MKQEAHPFTYIGSLLLSALAAAFLIWLVYFKQSTESQAAWVAWLPWVNATFNGLSAYNLVQGGRAIQVRDIPKHRRHMLTALLFSAMFLVSYIVYHSLHGDTRFPDLGWIRTVYVLILVSHIGLSILVLPVLLITLALALTGKFQLHPKFGRFALPVWLYVSVTGVIIVFFLKAYVPG